MPQQSTTAAGRITGRAQEWKGGKTRERGSAGECPRCLADCAGVSGPATNMGGNIAVGSLVSSPPPRTRGDADKYVCIYCT